MWKWWGRHKDNKKYFLLRGKIKNYNVLIDERNFYHQPINDLVKQYDEVREVSTGYSDDYTTGCFLDYAYFKNNQKLITVDLSRQKALDADARAIQEILFQGAVGGENGTKIKTVHYSWTIERNNARILQRNSKSVIDYI